MGGAQALALQPGVSRSGATISGGGSSYVDPDSSYGSLFNTGVRSGAGLVTLTWPAPAKSTRAACRGVPTAA